MLATKSMQTTLAEHRHFSSPSRQGQACMRCNTAECKHLQSIFWVKTKRWSWALFFASQVTELKRESLTMTTGWHMPLSPLA